MTVLVHNAEDTCVLWQKEKNPSIYHEVKAILYRGRAKIEQKVSKNFEENVSQIFPMVEYKVVGVHIV